MNGDIHDYFTRRAQAMAQRNDPTQDKPEPWQARRGELHRQFMMALGLDELPEPCELRTKELGGFSGPGYTAKKLAYQLLPDCWGSAHLYRPADLAQDEPTPAVLYTCGHAAAGVIGYQHHAIGWARRGYTCLIFDTIQQHDNPGDHYGLSDGRAPHWIALGYTAAGGEVFNGMRALDLLLSQPGVDAGRVGVTGHSGGGAQSFFLAIADERLRAVSTVCGVSDPLFAIPNRTVHQHCGCMYRHNLFAHDLSLDAALIAPRALQFCFARHDALYTPQEFQSLFARTRARFEELGLADRCELIEYDGPHGYNHTSTIEAIHRWFDHHVSGKPHPEVDSLAIKERGETLPESTLSVFGGLTPRPNRLHLLPELLICRGEVPLPSDEAHWRQTQHAMAARLRSEVFQLVDDVEQPQRLERIGEWAGPRDAWRGELDGMPQALLQLTPPSDDHEAVVVAVGPRGMPALQVAGDLNQLTAPHGLSVLGVEPRACGPTAFREEYRHRLHREGCLVGQTPTMMMVQDLHHLWPSVTALPRVRDRRIYLYGKGEGALAVLYHALLHPDQNIAGIILDGLPRSQADTTWQVLRVLRLLDLPHAVGLLAPRPVALVNAMGNPKRWYFAERAYQRLGRTAPLLAGNLAAAIDQMVAKAQ